MIQTVGTNNAAFARALARTVLSSLACAAGCASAPSGAGAPSPFSPVTDVAALRAVYDSGFARVVRAVPSLTLRDPTPLRQLRDLCLFRTEQVHWAKVEGDAYVSAEPGVPFEGAGRLILLGRGLLVARVGASRSGWLAIVPPGHRILRAMPGFMGVDMGPTHALLIRPAAVTPTWAGLLFVHHLSHLQEAVLGTVKGNLTRQQEEQVEIRVLWRTLTAADLLAQGNLRPALDIVIGRLHPDSLAELAEQVDTLDFSDFRFLDRTLPADGPVSDAEAQDRAAFFTVAFLIRYAETHPGPLPQLLAAIDHLYMSRERN